MTTGDLILGLLLAFSVAVNVGAFTYVEEVKEMQEYLIENKDNPEEVKKVIELLDTRKKRIHRYEQEKDDLDDGFVHLDAYKYIETQKQGK